MHFKARLSGIACVACFATVVGSYLLVQTGAWSDALRTEFEEVVGRYYVGHVGVFDVEVVPLTTVRATGIVLSSPDGAATFLRLGALDVTVAPWYPLLAAPRLSRVTLVEPVVRLSRRADGTLDVERYVRRLRGMSALARPVSVDCCTVVRGKVTYSSSEGFLASPFEAKQVLGRFTVADDLVTVPDLRAWLTGGVRVRAHGRLTGMGARNLDVAATFTGRCERLLAALPPGPARHAVAGPFRVDATCGGSLAAPFFAGSFTSPELACRASPGEASTMLHGVKGLLRYRENRLNLSSLHATLFGGMLTGSCAVDLGASPPVGSFELTCSELDVPSVVAVAGGPGGCSAADALAGTFGVRVVGSYVPASAAGGVAVSGALDVGALEVAGLPALDRVAAALELPSLRRLQVAASRVTFEVKDGAWMVRTPSLILNDGLRALPGVLRVGADGAFAGRIEVQFPWALLMASPKFKGAVAKALAAELELQPGPVVPLELRGTLEKPVVVGEVFAVARAELSKLRQTLAQGRSGVKGRPAARALGRMAQLPGGVTSDSAPRTAKAR